MGTKQVYIRLRKGESGVHRQKLVLREMNQIQESLTARKCALVGTLALCAFLVSGWASIAILSNSGNSLIRMLQIGIAAGAVGAGVTSAVCIFTRWNRMILGSDRQSFERFAAWAGVLLAVDTLLVEQLVYFFVLHKLDTSLRWQLQLTVSGLLAGWVAISKRNWRWVPWAVISTVYGVLWTTAIFYTE